MHSYFKYNGRKSTEFGIRILNDLSLTPAERDITTVEILGRHGDLTIDNKRYKSLVKEIKFDVLVDKVRVNHGADGRALFNTALRISDWLNVKGYHDFEWSMYPEFLYKATMQDTYSIHDTIRTKGRGVITVKFYPIMFYKSFSHERRIESETNIFNKGNVEALPLIRLVPKTDRIDVYNNDKVWFSLKDVDKEITIDSQLMQAYTADGNANNNLLVRQPLYPILEQGNNIITFDENTVEELHITPRIGRTAI